MIQGNYTNSIINVYRPALTDSRSGYRSSTGIQQFLCSYKHNAGQMRSIPITGQNVPAVQKFP